MPRRALSTIAKQEHARRALMSGFRRGQVLGGTITEKSSTPEKQDLELASTAKSEKKSKDKKQSKSSESRDKSQPKDKREKDKSQSKDKSSKLFSDNPSPQDTPKRKRDESSGDPQKKQRA